MFGIDISFKMFFMCVGKLTMFVRTLLVIYWFKLAAKYMVKKKRPQQYINERLVGIP